MFFDTILAHLAIKKMLFRFPSFIKHITVLAIGILLGSGITVLLREHSSYRSLDLSYFRNTVTSDHFGIHQVAPDRISNHYENDDNDDGDEESDLAKMPFGIKHSHIEKSELYNELYKRVRIFCWIMTAKNNTFRKAMYINATWAPHCNKYVFISSDLDSSLPTVELNVTEGRKFLWAKTKEAHRYIYENELNNYDWFLKADDDTFVIIENLRFMLLPYSPETPIHFGCKFKVIVKQGYMSGGAGYVLSREAVKRFVENVLDDPDKCKKSDYGAEDAELGKCLQNAGVIAGDSRDSKGRHRMLPFGPAAQFGKNNSLPRWFYQYSYYNYPPEGECCSDYVVSFHYINPATMLALNYFVYHVRPFGLLAGEWVDRNGLKGTQLYNYAKQKAFEYSPLSSTVEIHVDDTDNI